MFIDGHLRIESWMFETMMVAFTFLFIWQGRKLLGREKTSIFLWGSLIYTGLVENLMVINGAYDYFAYANYYGTAGKVIPGFSGWAFMMLFVPVSVSLGWFVFSFPAFIMADRLLSGRNIWLKASVAAVMLVSLDMLLDPVAVVNEWWRWTVPGCYLRGVSVGNYIGWFFMLFYFAVVYERTVIERGGFGWLRPVERLIFRTDTAEMSNLDIRRVGHVLYFRAVVFIPIMIITTLTFAAIPKKIGFNRFAPFENVFPNNYDERFPASARPDGAEPVVLTQDDVRKITMPRHVLKKTLSEKNALPGDKK